MRFFLFAGFAALPDDQSGARAADDPMLVHLEGVKAHVRAPAGTWTGR